MGIVDETIEDGVGQGWVADRFVPVLEGQLVGDYCGGVATAIFEDFQEVTALRGCEDGKAPIVDDQHFHEGDGFEDAFVAAIATGKREGFEHAWRALIEDRLPVTARLMAQQAIQLLPRSVGPILLGDGSAGSHDARSSHHPKDGP